MFLSKRGIIFILVLSSVLTVTNVHANYWGWRIFYRNSENVAEKELQEKDDTGKKEAEESTPAPESEIDWSAVAYNVLWYLPNCLLDLADCFTLEIGAGEFGINFNATKYASFGGSIGHSYNAGWTHKRQIGLFQDASYNADFVCLSKFEKSRRAILGYHNKFHVFNYTNADILNFPATLKHEDPYAIGVKAACIIGVNFQFHPVEFADFLTGLFLFDICDDSKKETVVRVK